MTWQASAACSWSALRVDWLQYASLVDVDVLPAPAGLHQAQLCALATLLSQAFACF
jgi:hypothetical protein